jgi:hypothetical protein
MDTGAKARTHVLARGMTQMKKIGCVVAFMATLALNAPANAYLISVLPDGTLSPSWTVETFDELSLGQQAPFTGADGGLYSGFGTVVTGSVSSVTAAPYFGFGPYVGVGSSPLPIGGQDATKYLSIAPLSGGSGPIAGTPETITYSSTEDRFGLYWGSVDLYNTIDFYLGATLIASINGSNVTQLTDNGCQTSFGCNGYVVISGLSFNQVVLGSAANYAFEIDNIGAAAPEPATWAMMLIGFAVVGFTSYRRSRKICGINSVAEECV